MKLSQLINNFIQITIFIWVIELNFSSVNKNDQSFIKTKNKKNIENTNRYEINTGTKDH